MEDLNLSIPNSFIFDFDSTVVSIETLDTIVKSKINDRDAERKIDEITCRCMNGEMDFNASLTARLQAVKLNSEDFKAAAATITDYIVPGMEDAFAFLRENGQDLFIISGGFIELVKPVAQKLGISLTNCFANDYIVDDDDNVIGVMDTPLAYDKGKVNIVRNLREQSCLRGRTVMIGDGMSDYDVFKEKQADIFIGCGFTAARPKVKENSPFFVSSPAELIALLGGGQGQMPQ